MTRILRRNRKWFVLSKEHVPKWELADNGQRTPLPSGRKVAKGRKRTQSVSVFPEAVHAKKEAPAPVGRKRSRSLGSLSAARGLDVEVEALAAFRSFTSGGESLGRESPNLAVASLGLMSAYDPAAPGGWPTSAIAGRMAAVSTKDADGKPGWLPTAYVA